MPYTCNLNDIMAIVQNFDSIGFLNPNIYSMTDVTQALETGLHRTISLVVLVLGFLYSCLSCEIKKDKVFNLTQGLQSHTTSSPTSHNKVFNITKQGL